MLLKLPKTALMTKIFPAKIQCEFSSAVPFSKQNGVLFLTDARLLAHVDVGADGVDGGGLGLHEVAGLGAHNECHVDHGVAMMMGLTLKTAHGAERRRVSRWRGC